MSDPNNVALYLLGQGQSEGSLKFQTIATANSQLLVETSLTVFNNAVADIPANTLAVGDVIKLDAAIAFSAAPGQFTVVPLVNGLELGSIETNPTAIDLGNTTRLSMVGTVRSVGEFGQVSWAASLSGTTFIYDDNEQLIDTTDPLTFSVGGFWDAGGPAAQAGMTSLQVFAG